MAIGPTLQDARLKKQLTTSQVAEITRMKVQIVDDLEHDDFHRIAATIYGKGFIKLFAECVDLDPKQLIADYMRSVKGEGSADAPIVAKKSAKASAEPLPKTEAQAPASDLFEFASSRRRRVNTSPAPRPSADATHVSASTPTDASAATADETRLSSTIPATDTKRQSTNLCTRSNFHATDPGSYRHDD
jgi:cytoskeletal protein RodZ